MVENNNKELIVTPEMRLTEQENNVFKKAREIKIETDEDNLAAGELTKDLIKPLIKTIKEHFKPIVDGLKSKHTEKVDERKEHLKIVEDAKEIVDAKQTSFIKCQRDKKEAQEKKLQEMAEIEAKGVIEESAVVAENNGDIEESERLREEAKNVIVEPVVLDKKPVVVKGQYMRKDWFATVINESVVPRMFLKVDTVALNEHASRLKENADVEGVEFGYTETLCTR